MSEPEQPPGRYKQAGARLVHRLVARKAPVSQIAWSPAGDLLGLPSRDGAIRFWARGTGGGRSSLVGHSDSVNAVAWSPNGEMLASGSSDRSVRLWSLNGSAPTRVISGHRDWVTALVWSPDGLLLASGSEDRTVRIWHSQTGKALQTLEAHDGCVNGVAWSPDGKILASVSDDQSVQLWDAATGSPIRSLHGHGGMVLDVAWSPDGSTLATASDDQTVRIWDRSANWRSTILEGHPARVGRVTFSIDGRLLASKCERGLLRLWNAETGDLVAELVEPPSPYRSLGLAFHPTLPWLASLSEKGTAVLFWELESSLLGGTDAVPKSIHYTNAKVVLVGDSGVGKSGLGLVLSGQPFQATESTHGRRVWSFDTREAVLEDGRIETRETLLWDLAGQPGYRLIHQLHLNEVAVALVVFDSRGELDPFGGVRHWSRALRQARESRDSGGPPMKTFLVAARVDRGGVGVSADRIERLVKDLGFDGYFETSAREGWNVPALREAMTRAIAWEAMPRVSSSSLFQEIKAYLVVEKQSGRLLSSVEDLRCGFRPPDKSPEEREGIREAFATCIGLVESRGLIKRLSFGNLVLLQPELLDAYASALVSAAKDEPDGLGSLPEELARSGRFRMSSDERLTDPHQEKLLLFATIEGLLRHEIALREQAEDGPRLVFPSQMTREHPDFPDPAGKTLIVRFEGPILNIYATLAVRLSHSGVFARKEMWKNAATFAARVGGTCGLVLRELEDGHGELTLFFDRSASLETRFHFEEFVHSHLKRRALPDSLSRRRLVVCPKCEEPISDSQATRRRQLGHSTIRCPVCDQEIPLLETEERSKAQPDQALPEMDRVADARRDRESASIVVDGKIATNDYDVLICHNNGDKQEVRKIVDRLTARGLLVWLDERELQPGLSWYDFLEQQFVRIKAAAVFIGARGVGPSQKQEINVLLNEFVPDGRPVIPVFLPDMTDAVDLPIFLKHMTWVDFRKADPDPLETLVWGITATREVPATRTGPGAVRT